MKKITLLLIMAFVGIQINAQITSAQIVNKNTISLEDQTHLNKTLSHQMISQASNRSLTATYVGSFYIYDGPEWSDGPQVYSGVEAAALIFGGSPSDYATSTNSNTTDSSTITNTAWASIYGISDCYEIAEDYSLAAGGPGYNGYGAVSAYVHDNCYSGALTYVWMIDESTPSSFITTWQTTAPNQSITIPTTGSGYNYSVEWGDGTTQSGLTANATHVYAAAGIYTVKISGDFPQIYFNNIGDRLKIKSIEKWGTNVWNSMNGAFAGCENLVSNATDMPNLAMVTDMYGMFAYARKFNGDINIGNWNVSNVTNMYGMFAGASVFNKNINSWNVSNVTNMENMFHGATKFNKNIGDWNVGNVTNMKNMFATAMTFNQNIGNWNVGSVTTMNGMFSNANSFNQDLGGWNVSNVDDMINMFKGITLSMNNYDALLNGWNSQTLKNNVTFNGGNSKYCAGRGAKDYMVSVLGWTITDGGLDCPITPLDYFITTWKTTMANETITIPTTGSGYNYRVVWGDGATNTGITGNATHTYVAPGLYTVKIYGSFPRIYFNNSGDATKLESIEQWGTNPWISMNAAFAGCENLVSNASDMPLLSLVTDMYGMFAYARSFNGDMNIGNWDVSNVTNMYGMFAGASVFNNDINNWNVGNVTNMENMFNGATVFNQDLNNWNVSNVTNMISMFETAMAFNQNIGNWNVGSVTTMKAMFAHANAFNQNIGNWNVSNVTDMYGMFAYGRVFNQNIGNWDVSNVTTMYGMFAGASVFNNNINNWNVSNVSDMENMFNGATNFNQDLSGWNVGNVTNMKNMFSTAMKFNKDLSNWNVGNVTNMNSMFYHANQFDQDLSNWNVSNVTDMIDMFKNVTLSTDNYDALLNGWSNQPLKNNVKFNGGKSKYCGGEMARHTIIANFNWTITDGGKNCAFPSTGERLSTGDNGSLFGITLYPNPMGNELRLTNSNNIQLERASIYDLTGRLIRTIDLRGIASEMTLDVSSLSTATYMIVINGENGQISKLMVKE